MFFVVCVCICAEFALTVASLGFSGKGHALIPVPSWIPKDNLMLSNIMCAVYNEDICDHVRYLEMDEFCVYLKSNATTFVSECKSR